MDLKLSFKKIFLLFILFSIADRNAITGLNIARSATVVCENDGATALSLNYSYWSVYYQAEALNNPPADTRSEAAAQLFAWYNEFYKPWSMRQGFSFGQYWRDYTASLWRKPVGNYTEWAWLNSSGEAEASEPTLKPSATSLYPDFDPATRYPLLTWTVVEGAVNYELEFTGEPPENPNGTDLSQFSLWSTREVYKNGYIADFAWFEGQSLYWRVRAIDYYGNPLGVFSDAQKIYIDKSTGRLLRPALTVDFNANDQPTPLYPVYAWIPIPGATVYEVELLSDPPENPNGTEPSQYRIWYKTGPGYDIYDDEPRNRPGIYYWRVRGLDDAGNPVGVYSETRSFTVDLSHGNYAACLGDSVTHGGGAISYSPSDLEYDFETYLEFPTVNLGRSGDTTETMAERFVSDVLPFQPRYLLILGGINSIRGGVAGQQVVAELTAIRDLCEENNIRPIFLTVPPVNPQAIQRAFGEGTAVRWQEELAVVNQFIRQQPYYIDIAPWLSDQYGIMPERYAIDGLHPDIAGKKIMAEIVNDNWARVTQ